MKRTLTMLSLITAMAFLSCSKHPAMELNPTLMGKWKISGNLERDPGGAWEDVYAYFEDCEKDDVFNFISNGEFHVESGDTRCDPTDPVIILAGTWRTSSNALILDGIPEVSRFTIQKLDDTNLELYFKDEDDAEVILSFTKIP